VSEQAAPTAQDYYDRVVAAADGERRLGLPDQSGWDIFPFEQDSLRVKPLGDLTLPEPPRAGEGGSECPRCSDPEKNVVWGNERWVLVAFGPQRLPFATMLMPREHLDFGDLSDGMAAELGMLTVRITRAVEALDAIGRVHLYKIGDGGSHLHAFLLARPAGILQLRGSCLTLWEEMLPVVPEEDAAAVLAVAVEALADLGEPRL
jgi:diadenosine tetraphosphate (Ap4A) HIT family hydrolase